MSRLYSRDNHDDHYEGRDQCELPNADAHLCSSLVHVTAAGGQYTTDDGVGEDRCRVLLYRQVVMVAAHTRRILSRFSVHYAISA